MRPYHVSFWANERARTIGCDIAAQDDRALLEGFSRAGNYAVALRRKDGTAPIEPPPCAPTVTELAWIAFACGPLWLFVAANYLLS